MLNIVTKQGGNDFRYDVSYHFQTDGLTSHPTVLPCFACTVDESAYHREAYRDFTTHLGGPILRDRLWFFAGFQHLFEAETPPGFDPAFPSEFEQNSIFWKINWQIAPRWKLLHSVHQGFFELPESPSLLRPFETTVVTKGREMAATYGILTHLVSDDTFWEVRFSGLRQPDDSTPQNGDLTLPQRIDFATGMASGGGIFLGKSNLLRDTVQGKLSHYAADFLGGDHDFKFGVEFNRGANWHWSAYPGGALYYDYAGEPYLAILADPSTSGGEFKAVGAFAEDVVRLGDRLTVHLGLRFDHNSATSPDLPERDALGNETGRTVDGLGELFSWNVVGPRLGMNLALTADGRTLIRSSYGRLYQGVLTGVLAEFHPGSGSVTQAAYDPETGDYSFILAVFDFGAGLSADPETRAPFTDQFSFGFEREIRQNMAFQATYAHKRGRDYTGWSDNGVYDSDTVPLPDGGTLPVFLLTTDPEDLEFQLTTRSQYFFDYDGLVLSLDKRWSRGWQALLSYSLSEARGVLASSTLRPGLGQTSSAFFSGYGSDPNTLTNAAGRLSNDRTHMFRLQGSVEIPKVEVLLGANFQHLTGRPWGSKTQVILPQGFQTVFLEPPGTFRFSSQTLLDLRVSKIFRFGEQGRLELLADFLNLLDETAEERIATDVIERPNFGDPVFFVDPRSVMIGVKLAF